MSKLHGTRELSIDEKFRERDIIRANGPDLSTCHELYHGDAREMRKLEAARCAISRNIAAVLDSQEV